MSASAANAEPRFDSWQVRHPVATGAISALTLTMVPSRFGDDLRAIEPSAEKGWTRATLALLIPHAEHSYNNAKTILLIFEVLIAFLLVVRHARKTR